MRLLRFGDNGQERPGVLVDEDTILDLSHEVEDFRPDSDWDVVTGRIRSLMNDPEANLDRVPSSEVRIGPPLARFGKIVCVGLNYRDHAGEAGLNVPDEPVLFMKAPDTVVGPNDDVFVPPGSLKTDYEIELAVVIAKKTYNLTDQAESMAQILGYTLSHDVSERAYQLERGGQWAKGKNCPTFNPTGPWIATTDEITKPQDLDLRLAVNGEVRQESNTAEMVFSVQHLVWYISQFMALYPGDLINTGTPAGVGLAQSPPSYLSAGDRVDLSITGLGFQSQRIVGGSDSRP